MQYCNVRAAHGRAPLQCCMPCRCAGRRAQTRGSGKSRPAIRAAASAASRRGLAGCRWGRRVFHFRNLTCWQTGCTCGQRSQDKQARAAAADTQVWIRDGSVLVPCHVVPDRVLCRYDASIRLVSRQAPRWAGASVPSVRNPGTGTVVGETERLSLDDDPRGWSRAGVELEGRATRSPERRKIDLNGMRRLRMVGGVAGLGHGRCGSRWVRVGQSGSEWVGPGSPDVAAVARGFRACWAPPARMARRGTVP